MQFFEHFGNTIRNEWERRGNTPESFGKIAEEQLDLMPPSQHVEINDLLWRWFSQEPFPAQNNIGGSFGQPPVTVYSAPGFIIEILFWLDSTTAIHQHGFDGAFHVLAGSSLESRYRYSTRKVLDEHLELGQLELVDVEHLGKGASRPIRSGRQLIHSVFHLPSPSVSLVVRTWGPAVGGPQLNYGLCGLAYDPFWMPEKVVRQRQLVRMLRRTDPGRALELASLAIPAADPHSAFRLLEACYSRTSDFEELLQRAAPHHPDLVEAYPRYARQLDRTLCLNTLRSTLQGAEHRFLLAMLLTVPSRKEALALVAKSYPGADPRDTFVRWLTELAALPSSSNPNHPLAGIQLDETALILVRHLLDGCTDGEALGRLSQEFDADEVSSQLGELQQLLDALRASPMFYNLLSLSSGSAS